MSAASSHRLDGLESDNLLAFLALLGLLRALEAADRERPEDAKLRPRAAWDIDMPPLRPRLYLGSNVTPEEITVSTNRGIDMLAAAYDFDGRRDLNHSRKECRTLVGQIAT